MDEDFSSKSFSPSLFLYFVKRNKLTGKFCDGLNVYIAPSERFALPVFWLIDIFGKSINISFEEDGDGGYG